LQLINPNLVRACGCGAHPAMVFASSFQNRIMHMHINTEQYSFVTDHSSQYSKSLMMTTPLWFFGDDHHYQMFVVVSLVVISMGISNNHFKVS
jgi:hypothetical protein